MIPPKKPGLDVVIGVGKGGPPRPPKGMEGAPDMAGPDDMPDNEPDGDEGSDAECMKRIEDKLDKIMDALGLTEDQGGGQQMPPDQGGDMGDQG